MLWLAILCAILAILFGALGFAANIAWVGFKILFWIFLALWILSVLASFFRRPTVP
jgi:uncharacterized membrane protein YtjA (UPF0391 family)